MFEEDFLSEKLQNFKFIDIVLVKIVYFLFGLLISTSYIALMEVSWIFYLMLSLIAFFPIVIHLLSFEGSYIEKVNNYLRTNKPSYQALLFFSMFFLACSLAALLPSLTVVPWYIYMTLIVILAIKPMFSNIYW